MVATKLEGSARERLLAAANELFYDEGVHAVGIDRVIERAGVAKASLYSTFGSKEELVVAYLERRAAARERRILERVRRQRDPRARIVSVFEILCELVQEPKFRGCAFVNASAEEPRESKVSQVSAKSRAWARSLLVELAREAGATNAEQLGRRLALLYDGAVVSASMDRDSEAAKEALAVAELLLTLHLPAPSKKARAAPRAVKRVAVRDA
jgi:AcrR family transcriptional regulator